MEIVINEHARRDLTDDEYKYLRLLEFHKGFIKGIQKIRKELDIPTNSNGSIAIRTTIPDGRKLAEKTFQLVLDLGIPYTFSGCIESFIQWGQVMVATKRVLVLNPELQLNRSILHSKKVWPKPFRPSNPDSYDIRMKGWYKNNQEIVKKSGVGAFLPTIVITKPLEKKELIEAINQEWDERIEPAIEDYKNSLPYPAEIERVPVNEIEEYVKLLRLKKEGKTHQEIADLLNISHDSVREKYSKITKFLTSIGFPSLKM